MQLVRMSVAAAYDTHKRVQSTLQVVKRKGIFSQKRTLPKLSESVEAK
jgi:hypothetical protein